MNKDNYENDAGIDSARPDFYRQMDAENPVYVER
jgi:hypothetical protein